jgi:hypothetical protein
MKAFEGRLQQESSGLEKIYGSGSNPLQGGSTAHDRLSGMTGIYAMDLRYGTVEPAALA